MKVNQGSATSVTGWLHVNASLARLDREKIMEGNEPSRSRWLSSAVLAMTTALGTSVALADPPGHRMDSPNSTLCDRAHHRSGDRPYAKSRWHRPATGPAILISTSGTRLVPTAADGGLHLEQSVITRTPATRSILACPTYRLWAGQSPPLILSRELPREGASRCGRRMGICRSGQEHARYPGDCKSRLRRRLRGAHRQQRRLFSGASFLEGFRTYLGPNPA